MRFPTVHLATSVVNRIKNIAIDIQQIPTQPPPLPDVSAQGAQLDQAMQQPVQAVPVPPGTDTEATDAVLQGGSAADAVKTMGVLDAMQ